MNLVWTRGYEQLYRDVQPPTKADVSLRTFLDNDTHMQIAYNYCLNM